MKPPKQERPNPEKDFKRLAKALGHGKMKVREKEAFLKENSHLMFTNPDFVSQETYTEYLKGEKVKGENIAIVGAGFPFAGGDFNSTIKALSKLEADGATLLPVDIKENRARSWLLPDKKGRKGEIGPEIEPIVADATKLPFANNSIGGYISTNLVNEPNKTEGEIPFVRNMLNEAYRVLKPEGFLIISSFGYIRYEKDDGTVVYNDNIDSEEIVPEDVVERLIKEAGFQIVKPMPLDHNEILKSIKRGRERSEQGPVHYAKINIHDACAFFAKK